MIDFFREGGAGMIVILLVGAILLFRELGLFFRTVLIKDHSKKNLRLDSMSVIVGVLALVLLGLGVTSLGAYVSVTGVMEHGLPINILLIGLKESITAFIVSATFSSLILHMHFTTRRLLNLWRAPIG